MNKPRFLAYPGQIHLIQSDQEMLNLNLTRVLVWGFDTETKPSFKAGDKFKTALLQLATDEVAYLFRLHYIKKFDLLREILENSDVVKVGAAIAHDLNQLQQLFRFTPKGFIDIQKVAKEKGLKNQGLKGMTEEVFGSSLAKKAKMTNWEAKILSEEQLRYAATDSWIGLALYRELTKTNP